MSTPAYLPKSQQPARLTMHQPIAVRASRIPGPKPKWGDRLWIIWVHQRDEMLRGDRPAMVAHPADKAPFWTRTCPVCAESSLQQYDSGELYCDACWTDFQVKVGHLWNTYANDQLQCLFVKPGQDFRRAAFPRKLPKGYPITI